MYRGMSTCGSGSSPCCCPGSSSRDRNDGAVELDLLADRDHADDRRGAAGARHSKPARRRFFEADRLERVVDAAAGQLADRLAPRRATRHRRRASRRARWPSCQLVLEHVDGDDHARAGDAGALDGARPTPPQPKTATVEPGSTFAVLSAAPTPVVTPQPISAARSSGMSSRIFTTRVLVHQHLLGVAARGWRTGAPACRSSVSLGVPSAPAAPRLWLGRGSAGRVRQ